MSWTCILVINSRFLCAGVYVGRFTLDTWLRKWETATDIVWYGIDRIMNSYSVVPHTILPLKWLRRFFPELVKTNMKKQMLFFWCFIYKKKYFFQKKTFLTFFFGKSRKILTNTPFGEFRQVFRGFLELDLESSCNFGAPWGRNFEKNAKMCIRFPLFPIKIVKNDFFWEKNIFFINKTPKK